MLVSKIRSCAELQGLLVATLLLAICNCDNSSFERAKSDDLTTPQSKAIFDQKRALWLDARSESTFSIGHIPGAANLPIYLLKDSLPRFVSTHSRSTQIVAYCAEKECDDSRFLADTLRRMGFTKVKRFVGGFAEWEAAGYPVERAEGVAVPSSGRTNAR